MARKQKNLKPEFGDYGHIGAARVRDFEDRRFAGVITTAGGLELTIAMVADGVGGGNLGERAAQKTIDEIIISVTNNEDSRVPKILRDAIKWANVSVFAETREFLGKREMGATIALAAVHENKLYVANAGDSRVYLISENKAVRQVTRDHTWAYETVRANKMSKERAEAHPKAEQLARSVGFAEQIRVDIGLYLNEGETDKDAFKNQGYPLNPGDYILVCSDGLIKTTPLDNTKHFVEEAEFYDVLISGDVDQAARTLVGLAVGRNVDDNVSCAVIEIPGGKKVGTGGITKKFSWLQISFLSLILCVGLGALALIGPGFQSDPIPPTPTPPDNTIPGHGYVGSIIWASLSYEQPGKFKDGTVEGQTLAFGQGAIVSTDGYVSEGTDNLSELSIVLPGQVLTYLGADTALELSRTSEDGVAPIDSTVKLITGQALVNAPRTEENDLRFKLETEVGRISIKGTMFCAQYNPVTQIMRIDCYEGVCLLESLNGESLELHGSKEPGDGLLGEYSQINNKGNILTPARTADRNACGDVGRFIDRYIPPLPTAEPTQEDEPTATAEPPTPTAPPAVVFTPTIIPPTFTPPPPEATAVPFIQPTAIPPTAVPTAAPPTTAPTAVPEQPQDASSQGTNLLEAAPPIFAYGGFISLLFFSVISSVWVNRGSKRD